MSYIILLNVLLTLIFFNTLKSPIKLIYITCSWCLPIKQHFTGFFLTQTLKKPTYYATCQFDPRRTFTSLVTFQWAQFSESIQKECMTTSVILKLYTLINDMPLWKSCFCRKKVLWHVESLQEVLLQKLKIDKANPWNPLQGSKNNPKWHFTLTQTSKSLKCTMRFPMFYSLKSFP